MKVGTDISVLAQEGRPDAAVLAEHLALADLAEPLGFDSLFGLEHHFTGYSMSPSPLQLLSYYAAKTSRITLGTCVIVLPWHDPIRVAEQIAYLDLLCGGRCMFGFGRGAATKEYEGFRIPDGGGPPALCRERPAHHQSPAATKCIRVGRRVLSRSRKCRSGPGPCRIRSGASTPRQRQPGIGGDHGQARLRHDGDHAERVEKGGGGHQNLPRHGDQRRPHAQPRR